MQAFIRIYTYNYGGIAIWFLYISDVFVFDESMPTTSGARCRKYNFVITKGGAFALHLALRATFNTLSDIESAPKDL
jgi:hypothetical protein